MNNCGDYEDLIIGDLDHCISFVEKERLDAHLENCEECSKLREDYRIILERVRLDIPADPGKRFWSEYDTSLQAGITRLKAQPPKFRTYAIAASVALIMLLSGVGWNFMNSGREPAPSNSALLLARELDQIYGPVSEETVDKWSDLAPNLSSITKSDELAVHWFEVEDESSGYFL